MFKEEINEVIDTLEKADYTVIVVGAECYEPKNAENTFFARFVKKTSPDKKGQ